MFALRLILRSVAYHRRMHAGLLLGTLLACAILTGALVMGDSVNQTLHDIAVARLGGIAHAMDRGGRYFSETLTDDLATKACRTAAPGCQTEADTQDRQAGAPVKDRQAGAPVKDRQAGAPVLHFRAASLLMLNGMASTPPGGTGPQAQLNRVQVLGVAPDFWQFAETLPTNTALGRQEVFLGERTAAALGVHAGEDVSLRVAKHGLMPQDAPLAARGKDNTVESLVTVKAVLSDAQLGRFSLAANQTAPHNVFVDRAWLQEQADLAGLANLAVADEGPGLDAINAAVDQAWTLEQIGLRLRSHPSGLVQIESERVYLDEETVRAALELPNAQPTLTYLVNAIAKDGKSTPYSFVEAGPVPAGMRDDQVVINQWVADQIGAGPGDTLHLAYYQVSPLNEFVEQHRTVTVYSVVPMDAMALERELAPGFAGLSDVENCRDWDIGMPMDKILLADKPNEAYWKQYGQTPKLIATFNAGKEMWGNRFGSVTAVRLSGPGVTETAVRDQLRAKLSAERLGLHFMPVRDQALRAVNQAMDFGGLFLGMSFFLIIAALVLLGLLYVFGLQQRTAELGLLLAVGWPLRRVRGMFLLETMPAALCGAALGALAGAGYALLLLAGLARWWPGAVAGAEIHFHALPATLAEGAVLAFLCAFFTLLTALWRGTRRTPRELMTADLASVPAVTARGGSYWGLLLSLFALLSAIATGVWAWVAQPDNPAESFFTVGALLLMAELGAYGWVLGRLSRRPASCRPRLWKIALMNLARRRGRSMSVAAVTACGCFLVFAVSAMQENMALHADRRDSAAGGFGVFAQTTVPLPGAPAELQKRLAADILPLKVRDGDDAGCLNLNHAQQPRLFGVDARMLGRLGAFAKGVPGEALWRVLDTPLPDGSIPALVGDSNTAQWGLQKKTGANGDVLTYRDELGREVKVKLVGALPMRLSLFQGSLLVSDASFTRLYPSEAGFRAFLVDAPQGKSVETAARLNRDFVKYGMDAVPAVDRLRQFYTVESAYLAMFLVLGGLGLVLGAGGTGIVVLRNLFERRAEIGLFHALGYTSSTVTRLLLLEHGALVLAGTILGTVASAASVLPLILRSSTVVSLPLQAALLVAILAANLASLAVTLLVGLPNNPVVGLREE
jgi:ABC-type lipoprotein release transport system permease subunit